MFLQLKINPHSSPQNHSYYSSIAVETSYLQNSCDCHYEPLWVGESNPTNPLQKKKQQEKNKLKGQIALHKSIICLPFDNGLMACSIKLHTRTQDVPFSMIQPCCLISCCCYLDSDLHHKLKFIQFDSVQ